MSDLSNEQKVNIDTFSDEHAVKDLYDVDGFTPLEEEIMAKYCQEKGKVLDVGCGTGRTTVGFYEKGFDVIGMDITPAMIDFAKKKHPKIDFRVMNACDLQFNDEAFDYLLFSFNGIDCIHPFEDRLKAFEEIHRVLKPGGLFMYSTHNALALPQTLGALDVYVKNILNLHIFQKYRIEDSPSGKLHMYYGTPGSEKKMLEKVGFEIVEVVPKKHKNKPEWLRPFFELSSYYVVRKR